MTFTKEQLIASACSRIEFAEMMLAGEQEPLKERTWSIELELARIALESLELQEYRKAATASFYRDGIEAAAKWVDQLRESYDNEYGYHDPDTGTFEFGNDAQREYSDTLVDVAGGIRALHPNACRAAMQQPVSNRDELSYSATQDSWVDCSERLPDETNDPDGGATCYLVLYAEGRQPNGGSNVQVSNVTYLRRWHEGMITHWMPLPAAPQQE